MRLAEAGLKMVDGSTKTMPSETASVPMVTGSTFRIALCLMKATACFWKERSNNMAEILPDGSIQSYHMICWKCGKDVEVGGQGNGQCENCGATLPKPTNRREPITMTTTRKIFKGTLCDVASQCVDPETGVTGSWLFSGGSHKEPDARVTPVFKDLHECFTWIYKNGFRGLGGRWIYEGGTESER